MRKSAASLSLLLLLFAFSAAVAEETLPGLFKQIKEEYSAGAFDKALASVSRLDALSAQPGFEADRTKLAPIMAFYRGAIYASMNRPAEAQQAFQVYLGLAPNAVVDPAKYSKPVVEAFNRAKEERARPKSSVALAYAAFQPAPNAVVRSDFTWGKTPVRYLLTDDEKKRWSTLQSNDERVVFVEEFWKRLDPTPETPENEFRKEFEKRILFADVNFTIEQADGRETDRANVLALMGPPSAVGFAPIGVVDGDIMNSGRIDGASLLAPVELQKSFREVWRYTKDRVPESVRKQSAIIDFNFLTSDEIGKSKMQKDSLPLRVLEVAADEAEKTKALRH